MQGYTDIRAGGWVARLPAGWRPYALLARFDRPIGSWLLFLPGLWAFALAAPNWAEGLRLTVLFGIGAVAMRGAGCVVNDLWDRDLDQRVERTRGRPLAAGTVRPIGALVFLAALCLVGLGGAPAAPPRGDPARLRVPAADRAVSAGQAGDELAAGGARPHLLLGGADRHGGGDRRPSPSRASRSGRRRSAGCSATTRSTRTRTARTTRQLGIGSTALRWGARTRPFLLRPATARPSPCWRWRGGWRGSRPCSGRRCCCRRRCWRGRWRPSTSTTPRTASRLFKSNREAGLAVALAFLLGRL